VHVSTPEDASSSRYNQSLYNFLPQAYVRNFMNAWKLEAERLKRKGQAPVSWRNELIWWYGISLLALVAFTVAFGWLGAAFFLGQSFIAFTLLEIVNYLEHYGLHRRKLDNGRYERTTPEHSWNSNYFLTNVFLFQLQRHSDHHAFAKRRYQVLRHHDIAPQLPAGYATMVVLACIPPLWRKVMNPRVEAYYQGEEHQLTS
jgi:alkane 1-monooxygenase